MTTPRVDETLLEQRAVIRSVACDDGLGCEVHLSCGHSVWIAVDPAPANLYCSLCVDRLVSQLREVQAQQRPV